MQTQMLQVIKTNIASALKAIGGKRCSLIAVSKTKPIEDILALYKQGHTHYGQNYVDQLIEKAPLLPADISWHFIGHLQSNKAKKLLSVKNLEMLHSVDSVKLATVLNKELLGLDRANLKVLVQAKTSQEDSKSGLQPQKVKQLARHIVDNCKRLQFSGLMTIGKEGDKAGFELLRSLRAEIGKDLGVQEEQLQLSMGMSADYQTAIQHGSTIVRVGSLLFGKREPKK